MTDSEDVFVNVALKNRLDESDILSLCDTATIVDLSTKHVEYFVRYVVVSFHKLLKLTTTHKQVLICESVWDVPANWTKLSSVLDNSMEEAESEEYLLVNFRLCAFLEIFRSKSLVSLENV